MRAEPFLGRLGECLSRNPRQRLEVGAHRLSAASLYGALGESSRPHAPRLGAVGNLLPSSTTTSPC